MLNIQKTLQHALMLCQTGQFLEAKSIYSKLIKEIPGNFEVLTNLGTIELQLGNFEAGVKFLKKSISINPNQPHAISNLGNRLLESGLYKDAISYYDKAISINPGFASAYYNKGRALTKLNDFGNAINCYKKAIESSPDYLMAYINLGFVLNELKRYDEAICQYNFALQLEPNFPEAHYSLGVSLDKQERHNDALASYNRAIQLKPDYAEAYYNRGVTFNDLKRYEDALASYDRAIQLKPDYAEAYSNRGVTFNDLKRHDDALASYNRAIQLQPDYAEAYSNRGVTFNDLNRHDDALASYNRAIQLKPDYAEAYSNRGVTFNDLKRHDDALASYDRAIQLKPDYAEAYYNRGVVQKELVRLTDARASYTKALVLKPDFYKARWALAFLSIPPLFPATENINAAREVFSVELEQLDNWFTTDRLDEAYQAIGSTQPFYLAYQEVNNKELLSQYGRICHRLMANWQKLNNLQANKISISGKIKIGIVGEQIRNHSVWNAITKGWFLNLDSSKFELHIFHLGNAYDDETKFAQQKAASFTRNQPSLLDWANAIIGKNIEVLIYPEIGMHQLTSQLANLRLSPIQVAAWGHPETSGFPTIDYYLSADLFETDSSQNAYTETLIKLPNLGCSYKRPPVVASELDIHKLGLDAKAPILLCPGMPFKYAPQYDFALVDIVKRLGQCKLVFFTPQKYWASILKTRLEKSFSEANLNIDDFVVFIPWLKSDEFHALMKSADVFLDTIGFSGFNTAMQAVDCALPIVTREGGFMRGRLASGILRRMAIPELITNTEAEYIELAVRLAQDKQYRDNISQKIMGSRDILYDDTEPIRALEDFLMRKCRGHQASEVC